MRVSCVPQRVVGSAIVRRSLERSFICTRLCLIRVAGLSCRRTHGHPLTLPSVRLETIPPNGASASALDKHAPDRAWCIDASARRNYKPPQVVSRMECFGRKSGSHRFVKCTLSRVRRKCCDVIGSAVVAWSLSLGRGLIYFTALQDRAGLQQTGNDVATNGNVQ